VHLIFGLALFNAAFLAAGFGLLRALRVKSVVADAGLAFCAGFALLLVGCCLLAVAGVLPTIAVFLLLAAAASSPLGVVAFRARHVSSLLPRRPRLPTDRLGWISTASAAAVGLAAGLYCALLLREATVDMLDEWDAWSAWTLRAKALVAFGDFPKANAIGAHPDYPPLVPIMQSLFLRFAGGLDTQALHVEYALLAIAFVLAVGRIASEWLPRGAAVACAAYVLLLPGLERNVPDALADVPVAIFAGLAAMSVANWTLRREPRWLVLAALFASAGAWTKNEGTMLLLCVGVVGAIVTLGRRWRVPAGVAGATALAYLLFYPWRLWATSHGVQGWVPLTQGFSLHNLLERRGAAGAAFHNLWDQFASLDQWVALPYLSLAALALALVLRRGVRVSLFAVGVPAAAFAFYVWVYTISDQPLGLSWLLATSSSRVMTSVGLVSAALLPLQLGAVLLPRATTSIATIDRESANEVVA
jgi:hypothetical protein